MCRLALKIFALLYCVSSSALLFESIRDFDFDDHGRLWAASQSGLKVFDGKTWITHNAVNNSKLSKDFWYTGLEIDRANNVIYLGTKQDGAFKSNLDLSKVTRISRESEVFDIFLLDSKPMIGSDQNLIWDGVEYLQGHKVYSITTSEDYVLVGTNKGVYSSALGLDLNFSSIKLLEEYTANDLIVFNGILWVATSNNGLIEYNLTSHDVANYFPGDRVISLILDKDEKSLLLGNANELKKLNISNKKVEALEFKSSNFGRVFKLSFDGHNTLWAASDKLLARVADLPVSFSENKPIDYSFMHYVDSNTLIAAVEGKGIFFIDFSSGKKKKLAGFAKSHYQTMIFNQSYYFDDVLWVATDRGLLRFDISDSTVDVFGIKQGLTEQYILSINRLGSDLYLGGNDGSIDIMDTKTFRVKNVVKKQQHGKEVLGLAFDNNADLLFTSLEGLIRLSKNNEVVSLFKADNAITKYTDIVQVDDKIFIGTSSAGVFELDSDYNLLGQLNSASGLLSDQIVSLKKYEEKLYIQTRSGLQGLNVHTNKYFYSKSFDFLPFLRNSLDIVDNTKVAIATKHDYLIENVGVGTSNKVQTVISSIATNSGNIDVGDSIYLDYTIEYLKFDLANNYINASGLTRCRVNNNDEWIYLDGHQYSYNIGLFQHSDVLLKFNCTDQFGNWLDGSHIIKLHFSARLETFILAAVCMLIFIASALFARALFMRKLKPLNDHIDSQNRALVNMKDELNKQLNLTNQLTMRTEFEKARSVKQYSVYRKNVFNLVIDSLSKDMDINASMKDSLDALEELRLKYRINQSCNTYKTIVESVLSIFDKTDPSVIDGASFSDALYLLASRYNENMATSIKLDCKLHDVDNITAYIIAHMLSVALDIVAYSSKKPAVSVSVVLVDNRIRIVFSGDRGLFFEHKSRHTNEWNRFLVWYHAFDAEIWESELLFKKKLNNQELCLDICQKVPMPAVL